MQTGGIGQETKRGDGLVTIQRVSGRGSTHLDFRKNSSNRRSANPSKEQFHGVVPYRYRPSDSMESNSVSVTVETCDKYSEAPALRAHSSNLCPTKPSMIFKK